MTASAAETSAAPHPPAHARVVIIGGGIMGCSVAYHLAQLGITDIVLLEQGRLTSGTTWHAAGLVGQLRAHESMTRLIRYSTDLYARLEAETGLGTGWKPCGSLAVARTPDRMTQLKRTAAVARAYGVDCEVVSAADAGARYPIMASDDLQGGVWLPGDGKANPADLTIALAKGARNRGVRIIEGVKALPGTVARHEGGRVLRELHWQHKDGSRGTLAADTVVLCGGQWSRAFAQRIGVAVPLFSCEHYYIVTDRIAGVTPDLPVLRDPDGYIYFKEEVGGLLMGGFEPQATPWLQSASHRGGIPENFEFQLLPDNWDAFEILMTHAIERVPALAEAKVKQFYNGPESFTADNNFIVGPAPGLDNLWVGCGFNSMGIASAGGAGKALAEWIVQGEPTLDLWPVDIRRFARFNANESWLPDRIAEVLGLHYKMPWPNRELESARPFRRSPLYAHLKAAHACFGSKMGWERANFFAPSAAEARIDYGWGHQNWHPWVAAEHRACRERVAIFDMSSFAKLLVKGADAQAALDALVANRVPRCDGGTVYTGLLNERGGYESDFTITRLADDAFMIVTGSAQAVRDRDVIERALRALAPQPRCEVVDVTAMFAVIAVMGPQSRALLQAVSTADFSNDAFPFGRSREIDLGYATVRATRLTYVGELGWELYVPVEFAVGVYETLMQAGAAFGAVNAGYYAIDSLRLEKGYRAWGRELSPEITPFEAGLSFAIDWDKDFRGRAALAARREAGGAAAATRRIVSLVVDAAHTTLWGGELILRDGAPAGFVSSAAFGHTVGKPVALGVVSRRDAPVDAGWLDSGRWSIDLAGAQYAAQVSLRAPVDPHNARVKC
ncbi:MAG: FAD-dependent oxidoreductase [Burkholderiaceae bacterium]|jgi:4-methylaminobutanoate oxidase (formaldehyde-forming)|nr:FAD-dependent oxidoreductase [Burkholderiaceae bacterium]